MVRKTDHAAASGQFPSSNVWWYISQAMVLSEGLPKNNGPRRQLIPHAMESCQTVINPG